MPHLKFRMRAHPRQPRPQSRSSNSNIYMLRLESNSRYNTQPITIQRTAQPFLLLLLLSATIRATIHG